MVDSILVLISEFDVSSPYDSPKIIENNLILLNPDLNKLKITFPEANLGISSES
jgi:hypothetical protein